MSASMQPSTELHFPPPPTAADTKSDPAATLAWLKDRLATIHLAGSEKPFHQDDSPKLVRAAYLDFYNVAFSCCDVTRRNRETHASALPLTGGNLYRCLTDEIRTFCTTARDHIFSQDKDTEVENARHVIEEYMLQWRRLQYLAGLVTRLLQPLERDWVQRSISEKQKGVRHLKGLHTVIWRDTMPYFDVDSTLADKGSIIAKAVAVLQRQRDEGVVHGEIGPVEGFVENLRSISVRLREES